MPDLSRLWMDFQKKIFIWKLIKNEEGTLSIFSKFVIINLIN